MKSIPKLLLAGFALATTAIACYKTGHSSSDNQKAGLPEHKSSVSITPVSPFNKEVGKHIPLDSAHAWLANYATSSEARINNTCILKSSDLLALLSQSDCVGIIFYNAWDSTTGWTLLPYGVSSKGELITGKNVPTSNAAISLQQASAWRSAYMQSHAGGIEGQFTGAHVFNELINQVGAKGIRIQKAFNAKGEQLILTNADETNPSDAYEDNTVCPPVCPNSPGTN
jgi:hypothetical protein